MSHIEFEAFLLELRLTGERFYDATVHPGKGRAYRHVVGGATWEGATRLPQNSGATLL